jgi:hypothetical protein
VPVPAAVLVAIEYVGGAIWADVDRIRRRTILGVYGVPAGTLCPGVCLVIATGICVIIGPAICVGAAFRVRLAIVLGCRSGSAVRGAKRLVILRPGPRFR